MRDYGWDDWEAITFGKKDGLMADESHQQPLQRMHTSSTGTPLHPPLPLSLPRMTVSVVSSLPLLTCIRTDQTHRHSKVIGYHARRCHLCHSSKRHVGNSTLQQSSRGWLMVVGHRSERALDRGVRGNWHGVACSAFTPSTGACRV